MIEAAYIGEAPRRIFTLAHVPSESERRAWGVVLCHPMGFEYVSTFRTYRALATQLAERGISALRFDYSGTGDSAGNAGEVRLADWRDDIHRVIDAWRATMKLHAVALIGLRLGATLALEAAETRDDVAHMVLWEPIADGAAYIADLRNEQAGWLREVARDHPDLARAHASGEFLGFDYGEQFRRELSALTSLAVTERMRPRILIVDEGTGAGPAFEGRLRESGAEVARCEVEPVRVWTREVGMERPIVPARAVQEVVSWLARSP